MDSLRTKTAVCKLARARAGTDPLEQRASVRDFCSGRRVCLVSCCLVCSSRGKLNIQISAYKNLQIAAFSLPFSPLLNGNRISKNLHHPMTNKPETQHTLVKPLTHPTCWRLRFWWKPRRRSCCRGLKGIDDGATAHSRKSRWTKSLDKVSR